MQCQHLYQMHTKQDVSKRKNGDFCLSGPPHLDNSGPLVAMILG